MRCLIADIMHESLFPMLDNLGLEWKYAPDITRDALRSELSETDFLIIRSKTRVDADLLGSGQRLKAVARAGAGIDNLDTDVLEQRNILVINAPEGNENAVGEHCLGMLLALMNNFIRADRQVRQGTWDREGNRGYELAGMTVGLIGYGHMGMSFARKLSGMSCNVLAYDKYKVNYSDKFCIPSGMDRICAEADVLSLHIPLTDETRLMVDDDFFNRFEKPIYFINAARGEIVRLSAVLKALKAGKLRGAALDVLENEKFGTLNETQQNTLKSLGERDDVLFTPHIGGWTFESYVRINEVLTSKLANIIRQLS
jgi:D-3-phosphoglycerate dehydrogenase